MNTLRIHFCWFGGKQPPRVAQCVATWRTHLPEAEFYEWNETNLDIATHPYLKQALEAKQWAFAADYARLLKLEELGGIYLDTDVEIVGDLAELLKAPLTLGFEKNCVHAGVMACEPHHPFVRRLLRTYDAAIDVGNPNQEPTSIVNRITDLLIDEWGLRTCFGEVTLKDGICILPADRLLVNLQNGRNLTVHHYEASWKKSFDAETFLADVKRYCNWPHAPLSFRIKEKIKMFLQFQLPRLYRYIRDRRRE